MSLPSSQTNLSLILGDLLLTVQRRIGIAKRLSFIVVARIMPIAKGRLGYSRSGYVRERTFVLKANAREFLTNFHRGVALSGYL